MNRNKQLGFEILETKSAKYFGGAHLKKSNPKKKRPISVKKSMHLVVRSSLAKGSLNFLRKDRQIRKLIAFQGTIHGVKIYNLANGGNHLHLIILPHSHEAFRAFIRSITGLIARLVLNVERGRSKDIKFWDQRPFTRIIEWGRDYKKVCDYLLQNSLEALGFISHHSRRAPRPLLL